LIKTGSNRFGSVLARFFRFDLVFSGFFCLGSVRFFRFQTYKTETKPIDFFKILIGFFIVGFFQLFFSGFLNLLGFLIFLLTPTHGWMSIFLFQTKEKKTFNKEKIKCYSLNLVD
jgi:hypothetical protein